MHQPVHRNGKGAAAAGGNGNATGNMQQSYAQQAANHGVAGGAATNQQQQQPSQQAPASGPSPSSSSPSAPPAAPDSCNIYIANLPPHWGEQQLADAFQPFGPVSLVKILVDANRISRGAGFVHLVSHDSALAAIRALDGSMVEGGVADPATGMVRPLQVKFAHAKDAATRASASAAAAAAAVAAGDGFGAQRAPHGRQGHGHSHGPSRGGGGGGVGAGQGPVGTVFDEPNVYVAGLPKSLTRQGVEAIFAQFGRVSHVKILAEAQNPLASRGIAFVKFLQRDQAARAIEAMDGATLDGFGTTGGAEQPQPLQVRWAKERRGAEGAATSFSHRQHPAAGGRYPDAQQQLQQQQQQQGPGALGGYMSPQMMYQPVPGGGVGFVPPHMMMGGYSPYAMQAAPGMGAMPVAMPVHPGAEGMFMAFPGAGGVGLPAPMAPPPQGPPGYYGAGPQMDVPVGYAMHAPPPPFGFPGGVPPHMLAYHPAAAAGFAGPSGPFPPPHAHGPYAAHPQLAYQQQQQQQQQQSDDAAVPSGQTEPPESQQSQQQQHSPQRTQQQSQP